MKGRNHWLRTLTAVVLAYVVTLGLVAVGTLSQWDVADDEVGPGSAGPASVETPDLRLRALPLVISGGAMEQLPRDRPFTKAEGAAALDLALREAGIYPSWPKLVTAATADLTRVERTKTAPHYPYRYPATDAFLRAAVPAPEPSEPGPNAWVDLASVLTINAARAPDDMFTTRASAMLAYALLDHARSRHNTCNVQLQLAHIVSLGLESHWSGTISEFRSAQSLCGNDPTPLMALGTWQLSTLYPGLGAAWAYPGDDPAAEAAKHTFAELDRLHPGLPLGAAGLGELALKNGARHHKEDQHFSARADYREALGRFVTARTKSADPILGVGAARAELLLGHPDRALTLVNEVLARAPGTNRAIVLKSEALSTLGDYPNLTNHSLTYPAGDVVNGTELTRRKDSGDSLPIGSLPGIPHAWETNVVDATYNPKGGGASLDFGFLPGHRRMKEPESPHGINIRLEGLYLAQQWPDLDEDALSPPDLRLNIYRTEEPHVDHWIKMAQEERRKPPVHVDNELRRRLETRQDLWRSAKMWTEAERVNQQWVEISPNDGFAWDRLGEVQFHQGKSFRALLSFLRAQALLANNPSLTSPETFNGHSPQEASILALVKAGASLDSMGLHWFARPLYSTALAHGQKATHAPDAIHYAASQLGLLALRQGSYSEAVETLSAGVSSSLAEDPSWADYRRTPRLLKGAQENNLALALALQGRQDEAVRVARDAVSRDPANPIFLETLAYAYYSADDLTSAVDIYREAISHDHSNYVARNNLGVLLAESNQTDQALEQFRAALAVRPDYGHAWFNHGVLDAKQPLQFLQSQGALARAAQLDRTLLGADPKFKIDHAIYDTGFDVSRALPPDWGFGEAGRAIPYGVGLLVLVVILARLAAALVKDKAGERFASWMTDAKTMSGWRRRIAAKWPVSTSIVFTTGLAAFATWHQGRVALEVIAVAAFSMAIAGSIALLRPNSYAWAPAIGAGLLLAPFSIAFTPLPCAHRGKERPNWSAVILLIVLCTVLVIATLVSPVPVIRLAAIASVAMLASSLLPVPPHDGAFLPSRRWDYAATVLLATVATALALNWI